MTPPKKISINGNFYFSVKRATIVSLAIIITLSGVALGVGFGMRPINDELNENCESYVFKIVKIHLDKEYS